MILPSRHQNINQPQQTHSTVKLNNPKNYNNKNKFVLKRYKSLSINTVNKDSIEKDKKTDNYLKPKIIIILIQKINENKNLVSSDI